ncbi:hypothetical protein [Hymenobacter metallicola]|uniref:Uncharacterized protein n=1 Tax=Hymenobacter metallicola TaxID=2563114 RepID=A0A4Z0QI92_9BACT|nr:hypothetical protein [Hymenobacter metallicola]TGE29798.1 hypothetical protein E5K02_10165 [Hymenobacter metallicola]
MATISIPSLNPVPLGVAGTGEAVILQGGSAPLNTIMRLDAQAQRQRQLAEAQKLKARDQELQDLQKVRSGLTDRGFLPYHKQLTQGRTQFFDKLGSIYQTPGLSRDERYLQGQKLADDYNNQARWTENLGERFKEVVQLTSKDKRYIGQRIDEGLLNKIKDSQGNTLPIGTFSPESVQEVLNDPRNHDTTEVVNQWLDKTLSDDQSLVSSAARPGGYGKTQKAVSNWFLVENGQIKLDSNTNKPIPRTELPEVLMAAEKDPFMRGQIDLKQREHQAVLQAIEAKMQNYEQLTPEERQLVGQETIAPKTRKDFLNELLLPHAYQRTSNVETYRAKPQPRVGRAGSDKGPGTDGTAGFGVAGVQTDSTGPSALPSPIVFPAPYIQSSDGTRKPVPIKGIVLRNFNIQVPGKNLELIENNSEPQDLYPGQARMVLMDKRGRIFRPTDPRVAESKEATEQWVIDALRKPVAKEAGYRLTYAIESTPIKENNLGSEEEVFQSLKQSYEQPATAMDASMKGLQAAVGGNKARAKPSDAELRDRARKIYGRQNGVYYLEYTGDTKRKLDSATPVYRQQEAQMRAEIERLNTRARQQPTSGGLYGAKPGKANSTTNKPTRTGNGGLY